MLAGAAIASDVVLFCLPSEAGKRAHLACSAERRCRSQLRRWTGIWLIHWAGRRIVGQSCRVGEGRISPPDTGRSWNAGSGSGRCG